MSFKLFFRTLIFSGVFTIIGILFIVNLIHTQAIKSKQLQENKVNSLLLAYELRQSSDDLTRLARTFSATGDIKYEKMYLDIVDIRNGKKPRPKNYNRIYWDLVLEYGQKPKPDGKKISLNQMMKNAGFTKEEFKLLAQAQKSSNTLIQLETEAMNAAKGLFKDSNGDYTIKKDPDYNLAIKLTHSNKYHSEKAKIVKPIDKFMEILEGRTTNEVNKALEKAQAYMYFLFAFIIIVFIFYTILFILNKQKIPNMYIFKDSLVDFFKYLNNEIEYSGTINIKSKDEIGEMTKVVNENILKTKDVIEQDKKLINEIINVLGEFENGDLSKRVKSTTSTDSLNHLTKLLNEMAVNIEKNIDNVLKILKEYSDSNFLSRVDIKDLKVHLLKLAEGVNYLGDSTTEMLIENKSHGLSLQKNADTLLSNVDILSSSSNEAAASIEETAAALEEITSNISNNTENIVKMAMNANELKESSKEGESLASQTTKAMDSINDQVTAINEAISVIDQIAFQTNILSLNAAVEAATAGEAGKGFAVVAQEVRNLASRSAEAAKEIKELVETATIKANDGKNIASKMIDGYEGLNKNITKTLELIKDVENSSKEQKTGIIQINDAVNMLDRQTQKNAAVANETKTIADKTQIISKSIVEEVNKKSFKGKDTINLDS